MSDRAEKPVWAGCLWSAAIFVIGFIVGGIAGSMLGAIVGEHRQDHARYIEERDAIAPAIADDPVFRTLKIEELSDGGAIFVGHVPTEADKTRLKAVVSKAIGEYRAARVVHVRVESNQ